MIYINSDKIKKRCQSVVNSNNLIVVLKKKKVCRNIKIKKLGIYIIMQGKILKYVNLV